MNVSAITARLNELSASRIRYARAGRKSRLSRIFDRQLRKQRYAQRWEEQKHPRADDGKFGSGGGGKSGKPKPKKKVPKKLNIAKAGEMLADMGYTLKGGAPYDMKNQQAQYNVEGPNGESVVMSPDDIKRIISG